MASARTQWAARLVVFVAFFDLFAQFPVVAPYARSLNASAGMVGLIVAAYSLTNLAGNVLAGLALDRWGRKWPLIAGLFASAGALLLYGSVQSPEQLLAVRAVHGLATSVLSPGAFALLGDAAPANRRARAMGTGGAVIAVAAVVAPLTAGVLRDHGGPEAVFATVAALLLVAALLVLVLARDTRTLPGGAGEGARAGNLLGLLTRPRLLSAFAGVLAMTLAIGTLVTYLPLQFEARGDTGSRRGLAFTAYALVALVMMLGPSARLADRRGRTGPTAAGLAVLAAGLVVLAAAPSYYVSLAGMAVFGLGFGLLFPAISAQVADASGPRERGAAFGLFYASYSLGVAAGSLLSGELGDWLGTASGLPFLVAALVAGLAAPLIWWLGRRTARGSQSGMLGAEPGVGTQGSIAGG